MFVFSVTIAAIAAVAAPGTQAFQFQNTGKSLEVLAGTSISTYSESYASRSG
jgi:hypothetical protein